MNAVPPPVGPAAPPTPIESDPAAAARVGRVLDGKWHLEALLGVGGMAAVYRARHRNESRGAVKILHPEVNADADVRERFRREGLVANKIDHPGVVKVIDDDVVREGADRGLAYLVMELLEGESVQARCRAAGGTLPPHEVLEIAAQTLAVLVAAHALQIVHRDLKPDNLFLARDRRTPVPPTSDATISAKLQVKVLDFGIARVNDGGGRSTRVGTQLGTPAYMAPEQARGETTKCDGRTDVFALGATMFRLLTGRRVHEGSSAAEIVSKMASQAAPSITAVAPHLSPSIAAIVDRALRFERDARYLDAASMLVDVRAAQVGEPIRHASSSSFEARDSEATMERVPQAIAVGPSFDVDPWKSIVRTPSDGADPTRPGPAAPSQGRVPMGGAIVDATAPHAFAPVSREPTPAPPLGSAPPPTPMLLAPPQASIRVGTAVDARGPTAPAQPIAAAAAPPPARSSRPPIAILAILAAFVVGGIVTVVVIVSRMHDRGDTNAAATQPNDDEASSAAIDSTSTAQANGSGSPVAGDDLGDDGPPPRGASATAGIGGPEGNVATSIKTGVKATSTPTSVPHPTSGKPPTPKPAATPSIPSTPAVAPTIATAVAPTVKPAPPPSKTPKKGKGPDHGSHDG